MEQDVEIRKQLISSHISIIERLEAEKQLIDTKYPEGSKERKMFELSTDEELKKSDYPELARLEDIGKEAEKRLTEVKSQMKAYKKEVEETLTSLDEDFVLYEEELEKITEENTRLKEELDTSGLLDKESSGTLSSAESIELAKKRAEISANEQLIQGFEKSKQEIKDKMDRIHEEYILLREDNAKYFDKDEIDNPEATKNDKDKDEDKSKSEPKPESKEDKEEDKKPEERNPKGKNNNVVYIPAEEPKKEEKEPEEKSDEKVKPDKELQKEYRELSSTVKYAKSRKEQQEAIDKLAEIMSDESNYEKYGITTGRIFNNSRGIVKAMARSISGSKNADAIRNIKEKLNISYDELDDKNVISAYSLKKDRALKQLMDNPDTKIAAEEVYKKVASMDRDSLNDDQLKVYDDAVKRLGTITGLRNVLNAQENVINSRAQSKTKWFSGKENADAKLLPDGDSVEQNAPKSKNGIEGLEELTEENPNYENVSTSSRTKERSKEDR